MAHNTSCSLKLGCSVLLVDNQILDLVLESSRHSPMTRIPQRPTLAGLCTEQWVGMNDRGACGNARAGPSLYKAGASHPKLHCGVDPKGVMWQHNKGGTPRFLVGWKAIYGYTTHRYSPSRVPVGLLPLWVAFRSRVWPFEKRFGPKSSRGGVWGPAVRASQVGNIYRFWRLACPAPLGGSGKKNNLLMFISGC